MKLSICIDKFISDRKLHYYTDKTIRNYREVLSAFLRYVGDIDAENMRQDILDDYTASLIDRHLSKASVGSYMRQIKAFINWLAKDLEIVSDKLANHIKIPKAPKKQITLFSPEDIRLIFDSVHEESDWLRARNKTIIALMLDSGLRQAEVCKILYKDIDVDSNMLLVHGKGDKDRYMPFGSMTLQFLNEYIRLCPYNTAYLMCDRWGGQLTENAIKKMMSKLKDRTALEGLSSHKLRHNFATNYCIDSLVKYGTVDTLSLKTLMGHESLQTTERYVHEAASLMAAKSYRSHLDSISWAP